VKTFTAPIASIRRDGGTQIRAALDEATVAHYAQLLAEGGELPPVVVFDDEKTLWLADGFHRIESELRAGRKRISCFRHIGTQRDALLYAVGANAAHGLPRSNADKRRAIEAMLADPEWVTWTDRRIAAAAHVGHELVARVREESIGGNAIAPTRQAADGREYPAKQRPRDSKPGQPTAAMHPAPAPDEPPPVDMLGLEASGEWLESTRAAVGIVDSIDQQLRQLQSHCLALPQPAQQRLRSALHDVGALARQERPAQACAFCRDPDGSAGRAQLCSACGGLGYLTREQAARVPAEQMAADAEPIVKAERPVKPGTMTLAATKVGRYEPKLRIEDEAGNSLAIDFEPIDDTDAF
jgi:uncharacterized ParB-like nuclease family protein